MTPPDFNIARWMLGSTVVSLFALFVGWSFTTDESIRLQTTLAIPTALILVFGTIYGSYYIDSREYTYIYSRDSGFLVNQGKLQGNVKLQIGNSSVFFTGAGLKDIGSVLETDQFSLRVANDQILVSTKIRDENGKEIAEIIDNEWKVAPSPMSFEKNFSRDALEVKNAEGDVVLQIRLSGNIVQIQGIWWKDLGFNGIRRMVVRGCGHGVCDSGAQLTFCQPKGPLCATIKPMFKYPSGNHPGELAD